MPARRTVTQRTLLLGVGAAVALPTLAVLAAPAGATVATTAAARTQTYPVPSSRVLTVRGHGFGHGHGMSQYGAWGAARRGLSHQKILAFYYPGTTPGKVTGKIRVKITADTTRDVVVSAAAGLEVHDLGSGKTYALPQLAGARRWRLNVDGKRTVVGWYDGAWHRYQPGGRAALVGDGQLTASGPLTLWLPGGTTRTYRGSLRAVSPSAGSTDRDTVDVLSLDKYVRGVVPAEMPASWSAEAVQAQAVAARTYATWSRDLDPTGGWQICDTSACQVYRGVDGEDPRANAAVTATARQVLLSGGKAAFTQFGSSSGGWTSAGSRPYLAAKADPYDDFAANPVHDWSVKLTAARVQAAYPTLGRLKRILVTARDGHGQWGGRVSTLRLDGSKHDVTLSGDSFRAAFGLKSTWFHF